LDHVEAEALRGVQTTAHRQDEAAVPGEFAATAARPNGRLEPASM
jgi:hypothetical protein